MCQSRTCYQPLHPPTPDLGFKAEEEPSSTHASEVVASASCDLYYINEERLSRIWTFPDIISFLLEILRDFFLIYSCHVWRYFDVN